ncbi:MAG: DUF433 domain-containing protein [Chloroflexota bacterium]
MTKVETGYAHIFLDERQVPIVDDTTTKVIEIVLDQQAYGWSPEEMVYQHPYLTLGQVHSALAYYWDHRAELDADIARRLEYVDELRRNTPEPPFVARLRALAGR